MRLAVALISSIMLLSGCKKDPPKPPEKVLLIAPAKNSECTPVQSTSTNSSVVRFTWQAADHTETYELRVTNLNTGTVQTKSTRGVVETLSLQKGTPFSWVVISRNSQTETTASSESWFFYNPGSLTTHVPFPAEIIVPKIGTTVFKDINNEVTLTWAGADIDNDIEGFEVYFSTENPPETLIASPNANQTTQKVSVVSETVYYWKVLTRDAIGNISDTGIVDFKVN